MRKAPDKKAKDEKNNSWDRNFKPVGLEDLNKGHWIVIKNFKTHTETIEAMPIPLPDKPNASNTSNNCSQLKSKARNMRQTSKTYPRRYEGLS